MDGTIGKQKAHRAMVRLSACQVWRPKGEPTRHRCQGPSAQRLCKCSHRRQQSAAMGWRHIGIWQPTAQYRVKSQDTLPDHPPRRKVHPFQREAVVACRFHQSVKSRCDCVWHEKRPTERCPSMARYKTTVRRQGLADNKRQSAIAPTTLRLL